MIAQSEPIPPPHNTFLIIRPAKDDAPTGYSCVTAALAPTIAKAKTCCEFMSDPIVGAQSLLNQRVVWPYLVPLLCPTWENDPHGPTLVVKTTCSGHGCNLRVTATSAVMPYAKGCIQDNRHTETFKDGILSCSQVVDGAHR